MISVCIASYNGEKYIGEQLDSILKQIDYKDEIVISDDGSTDRTLDVIKSYNDNRIKVVYNKSKHGYTGNFENALKVAKGDIIILSDQDDVWCKDKVKTIVSDLEIADYVATDAKVADKDLNIINESYWSLRKPHFSKWGNLIKCGHLGCCMAFRREVLQKALPFPRNHNLIDHDNWLMLVGSFYFKVKYEKGALMLYRRHGDNVSDGGFSDGVSYFMKIAYRLYIFYNLMIRCHYSNGLR